MNIAFYVMIVLIVVVVYVCLSPTFKYVGLIADYIYNKFKNNITGDEVE